MKKKLVCRLLTFVSIVFCVKRVEKKISGLFTIGLVAQSSVTVPDGSFLILED